MSDRLERLEERLDRMEGVTEALTARLAALESRPPKPVNLPDEAVPLPDVPAKSDTPGASAGLLVALGGRNCLILAGAYLLRALTEGGTLDPLPGVCIGLFYAAFWFGLAFRAAERGHRASANAYGLVASLIAYPLIGEATVRFHAFTPLTASIALTLVAGVGLLVAWQRTLRTLAWIVTLLDLAACLFLLVSTRQILPFALHVWLLAATTLWIGYADRWPGIRWITAFVLDVCVLVLLDLHQDAERFPDLSPGVVVAMQLAVAALYLGTFAFRSLWYKTRMIGGFEWLQSIIVIILGFEMAAGVLPPLAKGLLALLLAVGYWFSAFLVIERREHQGRGFVYFTCVSTYFLIESFRLLLDLRLAAFLWAAAAVVGVAVSIRRGGIRRPVLQLQATALLLAAAVGAGLARFIGLKWTASVTAFGPSMGFEGVVLLLFCLVAYATAFIRADETKGNPFCLAARTIMLPLIVLGSTAFIIQILASTIAGGLQGEGAPGRLALLRTGVLALTAVGIGWGRRWMHQPEISWVMYALLTLGAIKLAAEDLFRGSASIMVFSFTFYGLALIVAPRLVIRKPIQKNSS